MKEIRILITGVGRRVELIQAFRQASKKLNIELKIYGADKINTAPALVYCDYTRIICGMNDANYIKQLTYICQNDKIDLVLPTIDTDLLILSQSVDSFNRIGTKVLISRSDKIIICEDKIKTEKFFELCGLKTPKSYDNYKNYKGSYPCFIKPRYGSASNGTYKAETAASLALYARQADKYIVQPFIEGKEFTIDIFCDFDGNPLFITPRERLEVRAGEVLKARIDLDSEMIEQSKKICEVLKPCGPITVQLIKKETTGENYFLEINPRYGGGVPLSMKAGADSAEAVLRLLCGETLEYCENEKCHNAVYSRFDQSACIFEGDDPLPVRGVIFDLDDTLYSEKQYIRSGFRKISEYLGNADAEKNLWMYFEKKEAAIDQYLMETGQFNRREECLKIYKEHRPDIELYDGARELISELKESGIRIGIITDGCQEEQHNKLKALNLEDSLDDIIITDELGGIQFRKPNDISFRIMQNRWMIPFEQIVYVGDNPDKDFQACRQLGMRWIYFKNVDGLYSYAENSDCSTIEDIRAALFPVRREQ